MWPIPLLDDHFLFLYRYSHSLPRRNRLYSQSTTQSSQKPPNRRSYHSPQRQTAQFQTGVHSYSTPYKETNYKQLPSGMTPIDNQVIYSNHEDTTLTARYTAAREGQNHNRELYASSNPQPLRADTLELDFYSTISRHATPYKPISVSTTHNYHTPAITRQSHSAGRSGKRSNNSTYSEDEGVVMTSESDSSVSQYPTYENRDSILAARQRPLSNGRFPTNAADAHNSNTRSESQHYSSAAIKSQHGGNDSRKANFDYTKYSWDKTPIGSSYNRYADYTQPTDKASYLHTASAVNEQHFGRCIIRGA